MRCCALNLKRETGAIAHDLKKSTGPSLVVDMVCRIPFMTVADHSNCRGHRTALPCSFVCGSGFDIQTSLEREHRPRDSPQQSRRLRSASHCVSAAALLNILASLPKGSAEVCRRRPRTRLRMKAAPQRLFRSQRKATAGAGRQIFVALCS